MRRNSDSQTLHLPLLRTDTNPSTLHRMTTKKQSPNEFLKQLIGRPVVVKLTSGVDYRGIFSNLDGWVVNQLAFFCHLGSETTLAPLNPVWGCVLSDPQSPLWPCWHPWSPSLQIHECNPGTNRGVYERRAEEQVRWYLHQRQQRTLHQCSEEEDLVDLLLNLSEKYLFKTAFSTQNCAKVCKLLCGV